MGFKGICLLPRENFENMVFWCVLVYILIRLGLEKCPKN